MCDLIVVTRPGHEVSANIPDGSANVIDTREMGRREIAELLSSDNEPRVFLTDAAMMDVSSTAIRAVARSKDRQRLKDMVPEKVASYIEKYELYQK